MDNTDWLPASEPHHCKSVAGWSIVGRPDVSAVEIEEHEVYYCCFSHQNHGYLRGSKAPKFCWEYQQQKYINCLPLSVWIETWENTAWLLSVLWTHQYQCGKCQLVTANRVVRTSGVNLSGHEELCYLAVTLIWIACLPCCYSRQQGDHILCQLLDVDLNGRAAGKKWLHKPQWMGSLHLADCWWECWLQT